MKKILALILFIPLLLNGQTVIDHTMTHLYDNIPDRYIDSVKKMNIWIPGASHAGGYYRGLELLDSMHLAVGTYRYQKYYNVDFPSATDTAFQVGRPYAGDEKIWTSATSINAYKSIIGDENETANPLDGIIRGHSYEFSWHNDLGGTEDPVYFTRWAGETVSGPDGDAIFGLDSGDSILTGNRLNMTTYTDTFTMYNAWSVSNSYPSVFIYSTGPTDYNDASEMGYQRELKNKHIRDVFDTISHDDAFLIDYADILNWSGDSLYYTTWDDDGTPRNHNTIHPDNEMDYDSDWNIIEGEVDAIEDHIGEVGAVEVAKGMWVMAAMMAGWDGDTTGGDIGGQYYVAHPDSSYNGMNASSDSNDGSFENPWAGFQHAFETADAGDTVYFRGGVYKPLDQLQYNPVAGYGNNGTYGNHICFFNYPGETPIIDYAVRNDDIGGFAALVINNVTYAEFKGLTVRRAYQVNEESVVLGWSIADMGWFKMENCVATEISGPGIRIAGYDTAYVINNDSYSNCDTTNIGANGGRGDGFVITSGGETTDTLKILYMYGNRAWYNSDDGIDISSTKQLDMHHNWSFCNGRIYGDGDGFKFAYGHTRIKSKRKLYNNVTWNNWSWYDDSPDPDFIVGNGVEWTNLDNSDTHGIYHVVWNNTSFRDGRGFTSAWGAADCDTEADMDMYNNIAFDPITYSDNELISLSWISACNYGFPIFLTQETNTWIADVRYPTTPNTVQNPAFTVTEADFVGPVDSTSLWNAMTATRDSDGSLPTFTNLNLVEGSDLINGGTDVGLSYNGSAPDIGAFESNYGARTRKPMTGTGSKVMISNGVILHNNE